MHLHLNSECETWHHRVKLILPFITSYMTNSNISYNKTREIIIIIILREKKVSLLTKEQKKMMRAHSLSHLVHLSLPLGNKHRKSE